MSKQTQETGGAPKWSGSFGFIMAAAGSAVGMGNLWRFPMLVGESGGGAFVLVLKESSPIREPLNEKCPLLAGTTI